MGDCGVFPDNVYSSQRSEAGTICRILLENFMCHSNLQIELGDRVNFITGQNGSGKSAILTALCVAFGCRAKGTQRAATLKDFIKTGCSYSLVHVEIKNQGEDAFKPELYGDVIILERKISESTSSTILKNQQGRKVSSGKEELRELVEHFNIDVENPCVIMSQDKSREFLHSGNAKDKFKFFFRATLLEQVNDLLQSIFEHLKAANALVDELEASIRPIEQELSELQGKIKNMEQVEEISQQVNQLKQKLAWSWVYDVDRQLREQTEKILKLKKRIPTCQAKIDWELGKTESLKERLNEKKAHVALMMEKSTAVRRNMEELKQSASMAARVKFKLQEEYKTSISHIQKKVDFVRQLEKQVTDIHNQHLKNTQAEESEMEDKINQLQHDVDSANSVLSRLKEEESSLLEQASMRMEEFRLIAEKIKDHERRQREINSHIRELKHNQTNKVTAFGGDRVISLLRAIERNHHSFKRPPIGPIGSHVTLVNGETWAPAAEQALGRLLNAFIASDHKDSLALRRCAREANYNNLQILIYDFSRPRLNIPQHMLPQTNHPTTLSVLNSDNPTVVNVLVDMGSVERQVLVKDYEVGKTVAFDRRISNLKEVYTLDGYKMFSRGSVQTILPPNKRQRTGRLCGSFDEQIRHLQKEELIEQERAAECERLKRESDEKYKGVDRSARGVQMKCLRLEKEVAAKKLELRDMKSSYAAATNVSSTSSVDELRQDIAKIQEEIHDKENSLEKLQFSLNEAEVKARELKLSFEELCESAKEEITAFEEAENELKKIEKDLYSAETEKVHYESVMKNKVLPDINEAEAQHQELENKRKESYEMASIICSETDIQSHGSWDGSTPEQLSAQLNRLNQRLQHESRRYSESIDDLRMMYERKERKILRKRNTYKGFREKLNALQNALDSRWDKFQRNASYLKRQLTWHFNAHLGRKGISGSAKVSYEEKTLSVEVKMPQDASNSSVRDTRALSGGERSFSTLCFALALHRMTEAPFRAMDEFDVFMDAVSRKISLDVLVDFAIELGSQWIFITPHDISIVESNEHVKKQQMAAPRS